MDSVIHLHDCQGELTASHLSHALLCLVKCCLFISVTVQLCDDMLTAVVIFSLFLIPKYHYLHRYIGFVSV